MMRLTCAIALSLVLTGLASGQLPVPGDTSLAAPAAAPAAAAPAQSPGDAATPADSAQAPAGAAPAEAPGDGNSPALAPSDAASAPAPAAAEASSAGAPGPGPAAAADAPLAGAPAPGPAAAAKAGDAGTVFAMAVLDGYFLLSKPAASKSEATMELHHAQPTTAYIAPGAAVPLGQYSTARFVNFGSKTGAWFANATAVLTARTANGTSFSVVLQLHGAPATLYYVTERGKIIFTAITIIYPGSPGARVAAPGSMAALYLAGGGPPSEPVMDAWQPTDPKDPGLMVWQTGTLFIDAVCDGRSRPAGLCAHAGLTGLKGPAAACSADGNQGAWNGTAFCA